MFSKLSQWLDRHLTPGGETTATVFSPAQKQLAMAALLVEVAQADHHFSDKEADHLLQLLGQKFALSPNEQSALIDLAKSHSADATSLYQFTSLVHQYCTLTEKQALLAAMWELAYVDGYLDKYEEYVIRKVADLLYLPHTDFMRAKHRAREKMVQER